jgi:hypothetical protein
VIRLSRFPLSNGTGSTPNAGGVRLEKRSEKKNLVTDQADWLSSNGLTMRVGGAELAPGVPPKLHGLRLGRVFASADHAVAAYGPALLVTAPGKQPRVYDVSQAASSGPRGFEVMFAELVGKVLLVELAYNGYAKDSGGKNGYLAAFGEDGGILWVAGPLVANFTNFHVAGSSIIVGYGFTAEPDFLHVLDLSTGALAQKIPLKTGPEAILVKGDLVFVRTYDVDYVFAPKSPLPPTPQATLAPIEDPGTATRLEGDGRCWVRAATLALEKKDPAALDEAIQALGPLSNDRVLFETLTDAKAKLAEAPSGGAIDLSSPPPVVARTPTWGYELHRAAAPMPSGKAPVLVKRTSSRADPVRALNRPPFSPDRPFFIAPVERGRGAPDAIPKTYAMTDLRAVIPSGERTLLVYGGRYLAVVAGEKAQKIFDLDPLRHPPDPNPQWKEFAEEDVTFAQVKDGVVYVCNGGGSYAKEVHGKKGFLTALDLASGETLWRSEPLVCNATFVLAGDYIVSGYGFTAEPDFVFLVRRADGKTVQRVPVDSGPDEITLTGDQLHVETYGHRYDFELRAR